MALGVEAARVEVDTAPVAFNQFLVWEDGFVGGIGFLSFHSFFVLLDLFLLFLCEIVQQFVVLVLSCEEGG